MRWASEDLIFCKQNELQTMSIFLHHLGQEISLWV